MSVSLAGSPKFIVDVEQGSDEWRQLRIGIPTASAFDRIVTEVKGEYSETGARKYAMELAVERIMQEDESQPIDHLRWVERGKLLEADAVKHYEAVRGRTTDRIGFILSADGRMGCSPDRVHTDRLTGVEMKCPMGATHAAYLIDGPGKKYRWQVWGSMLIAQFDEWDFCSYHPNFAEKIVTYRRDADGKKEIARLADAMERFCDEVDQIEVTLRRLGVVEPMGKADGRSDAEWQKMLEADPGLWALG